MDLYRVCSNYTPGTKNGPTPRGHMFNIGLHRENMKNSFCVKPQGRSLDTCYVASSHGPLPHLFKLWSWSQKWPGPRGHIAGFQLDWNLLRPFYPSSPNIVRTFWNFLGHFFRHSFLPRCDHKQKVLSALFIMKLWVVSLPFQTVSAAWLIDWFSI